MSIASATTSFASRTNERRQGRLLLAVLVFLGLVCLLPASTGIAETAVATSERANTSNARLRERLQALDEREDAKFAKGAIEQARRA